MFSHWKLNVIPFKTWTLFSLKNILLGWSSYTITTLLVRPLKRPKPVWVTMVILADIQGTLRKMISFATIYIDYFSIIFSATVKESNRKYIFYNKIIILILIKKTPCGYPLFRVSYIFLPLGYFIRFTNKSLVGNQGERKSWRISDCLRDDIFVTFFALNFFKLHVSATIVPLTRYKT